MATDAERLRMALRLSLLVYSPADVLEAWRGGATVQLEGVPFGEMFEPEESKPLVHVMLGMDPSTGVTHKAQWLACEAGGTLFVSFKGTDAAQDMLLDMSFPELVTPSGMRVHAGFYSGVQAELPRVLDVCNASACERIVFCGHSLGGAMATVALYELSASALWKKHRYAAQGITFGAPVALCHGAQISPFPQLPQVFAEKPPLLLNVVNNFDIVPRALILDSDDLAATLSASPTTLVPPFLAPVARIAGLHLKFDALVHSVDSMRSLFRPSGTYLFLQSHICKESGLRVAATFLSDPDEVRVALQFFPGPQFQYGAASDQAAFVDNAVKDHMISSYWSAVDQVCQARGVWGEGFPAATAATDALIHAAEDVQLENYAAACVHGGVIVPPAALLLQLDDDARERLERAHADILSLLPAIDAAKPKALVAARGKTRGVEGRNFARYTAVHHAGGVCGMKRAVAEGGSARTEQPMTPPKDKPPTEAEKAVLALAKPIIKELKKPKVLPFIVVNFTPDVIVVDLPAPAKPPKGGLEPDALKVVVQPWSAANVAREVARWSTANSPALMTCTVEGDDTRTVRVPYPDIVLHKVTPGTACCVLQRSNLLPLVAQEGRVTLDKKYDHFTPGDAHPVGVTACVLRRHDFAQVLDVEVEGAAQTTFAVHDPTPPGFAVPEAKWNLRDACDLCETKFRGGLNVFAAARHHCRGCGKSVCDKCSPTKRTLHQYSGALVAEVRVCTECEVTLRRGAHIDVPPPEACASAP